VGNHGVRIPMDYDLNAAVTFGPFDNTGKPLNNCLVRPLCDRPVDLGRAYRQYGLSLKPTSSNYHAYKRGSITERVAGC